MADRNLNIRVAFSALNNMSRPVNAARQSAAALASQINQTKTSIKGLERQATSFDRLTAANKKTTEQLAQAKEQARQMAAAYGPLRQRSAEQVAALNQQRAAIRQLTQQQKGEQTQLNQLRASFYSEGIAISSASRATEQINQRTAQYNRQLAEQQRRLDAVNQAQARYHRAKETGEKLQSTGMKTAATGAAIVAPVVAAIKSYSSLEDAMKGVSKQVNGLRDDNGNRTAQFAEMQKAIKDASENLPMPNGAVDYAALVEGGARMGVANSDDPWQKQKKDLLNFANTAAMASKAFELPADQLSESLGKIAGLYKVPIQNIGELGDAINYLDDNAKSKGSEIIDVLLRVGGTADQLGYKNAAALGSTFLSLGEGAETAGTAVKAMVRELGNAMVQPDRFMEGLDALGLSAEKVQKNMAKDAMGTIMAVMEATKKLDDDKQLNVLTQLFGDEYAMAVRKVANNLPELRRQLELTHGTAAKGSMKRESDIDKDSLSSQWQITKAEFGNNFSALGETMRGPMMAIMKSVGGVLQSIRGWIEANPVLVAAIMKTVAAIGAILTVLGTLMLALGAVLGPMALVRLSFTTLAGEGGIARLTGGVMRLGGAFQWLAGSPMQALLSACRMVFGPLITLLAGISAPVWGLIALFAAAAVAVIKFWEPIQAFFTGFFNGIMTGLQPVFDAFNAVFAPLAPIFDAIGSAISGVWDWFTKLLEPIKFSSDALETCTTVGETFGRVLGTAISGLLWPLQKLMEGVGWVLEKLDLIPAGLDAANAKAESLKKDPVVWEWDPQQKKMVKKDWQWSPDKPNQPKPPKPPITPKPVGIPDLMGAPNLTPKMSKSLDKIADNTGKMAAKDGPGEIVFKNKQPYIPIRGGYSEPLKQAQRQLPSLTDWVTQQAGSLIASVTPWQVEKPAARVPVSASPSAASVAALMPAPGGDVYNLNFDFSGQKLDEETIIRRVREELALAKQQADRRKRSQLTDHV